jgi:hypothetical protein
VEITVEKTQKEQKEEPTTSPPECTNWEGQETGTKGAWFVVLWCQKAVVQGAAQRGVVVAAPLDTHRAKKGEHRAAVDLLLAA